MINSTLYINTNHQVTILFYNNNIPLNPYMLLINYMIHQHIDIYNNADVVNK